MHCLLHFSGDIFVVTAQLLVNALQNGQIENLQSFSLIVFDECHHSNKKHMFNEIMSRYLDLKLVDRVDVSQLPQVGHSFNCVNHIFVWTRIVHFYGVCLSGSENSLLAKYPV